MALAGDQVVAMATVNNVQNTAGTTTSTSFTATLTGGTACVVAFAAPPSGAVLVHNAAGTTGSTGTVAAYCSFEVRTGSTPGSGSVFLAASINHCLSSFGTLTEFQGRTKLVSGLTPGATYHARQMFAASSGTATVESKELIVQPVI